MTKPCLKVGGKVDLCMCCIDHFRNLQAYIFHGALVQYAKFVKPAFDDFVLPSKKYADVIIPRGGDNHVAVDLIVQHIRTKLGQHDLRKIYQNVYVIQSTFQVNSACGLRMYVGIVAMLGHLSCH